MLSRIGGLVAAAGVIWSTQVATSGFSNIHTLLPLPAGPLEVCGVGVIIWLLGKWRRSVNLR